MPAVLHDDVPDVDHRLAELGLPPRHVLQLAVDRGEFARSSCTSHTPPIAAAISAWGETVCGLRDSLAPLGWVADDSRNFATSQHHERKLAVAVAAGDENTGVAARTPATRSAKGLVTALAIASNNNQGNLFGWLSPEVPRPLDGRQTWFLLGYRDAAAGVIRSELSLPRGASEDGKVVDWTERLILPPRPINPPLAGGGSPVDRGPNIDVPVERRTG